MDKLHIDRLEPYARRELLTRWDEMVDGILASLVALDKEFRAAEAETGMRFISGVHDALDAFRDVYLRKAIRNVAKW